MQVLRRHARRLPGVVLAGILLVAQLWAMAHAFEHDPVAPSVKACASCITVAQLGSAACSAPAVVDFTPAPPVAVCIRSWSPTHVDDRTPRQRGPPLHSLIASS